MAPPIELPTTTPGPYSSRAATTSAALRWIVALVPTDARVAEAGEVERDHRPVAAVGEGLADGEPRHAVGAEPVHEQEGRCSRSADLSVAFGIPAADGDREAVESEGLDGSGVHRRPGYGPVLPRLAV